MPNQTIIKALTMVMPMLHQSGPSKASINCSNCHLFIINLHKLSPDIINRFHNLAGEEGRTRKEQSFLVPVEEIREKGYDLSINKYKEIEREKVEYESSEVILDRITSLEKDIISALNDFRIKFM